MLHSVYLRCEALLLTVRCELIIDLLCSSVLSPAFMNNVTSYLFDGMMESKYMLRSRTTRAIYVMKIIIFMVRFQLVSVKVAHYAEL